MVQRLLVRWRAKDSVIGTSDIAKGTVFVKPTICSRELTEVGHGAKRVIVSFERPEQVAAKEWKCSFRLEGEEIARYDAYGVDSVQALCLALERARIILEESGRRFVWIGGDDGDHGFRLMIPSFLGYEFAKQLEAEVTANIEAEIAGMCAKRSSGAGNQGHVLAD